ncbi:quercetin 2,3-dioxygenase [Metabacillus sp. YM-086]|uniref:quercetin 2,3-dioxygenase n=1 Tax=Metabacillus sp. YM-086 TaxID=3341729 RepID=UPI003A8B07A0
MSKQISRDGSAYLLKSGFGKRYLLGSQVATIIADGASTNHLFDIVLLTGGKGDYFPPHLHRDAHEGIYVLDGRLEVSIDGKPYLLTPGDFAHIPSGIVHEYKMNSHRTRFLSFNTNGKVSPYYSVMGIPYEKGEQPPRSLKYDLKESEGPSIDIQFTKSGNENSQSALVQNRTLPDVVQPYVLEAGEGIGLLTGDQLHKLLATQLNTNGEYIVVVTEGPNGDKIVDHYHEHHTETFYCLQGQMTMWMNGNEVSLSPGDFLHVPPNTTHSYRLDSAYTKFIGILSPGIFEPFFRTLGDPYEDYIFPSEPGPLRFDRVLQRIEELDLKVVGGFDSKREAPSHTEVRRESLHE